MRFLSAHTPKFDEVHTLVQALCFNCFLKWSVWVHAPRNTICPGDFAEKLGHVCQDLLERFVDDFLDLRSIFLSTVARF